MRRVQHWLVRLYPRTWLDRYEKEFRALFDDAEPQWVDWVDVLKEGVMMRLTTGVTLQALGWGMTAAAIAVFVLWLMPAPYESKATIAMRSAYFREYPIPEQMNLLSQRTKSREFLAKVVDDLNLYPNLRASGEQEKAIDRVRGDIRISNQFPQPALAITNVSFRYPDPKAVTNVTNVLVTRLIDEQIRLQESAREASADPLPGKGPTFWGSAELLSLASEGKRPPIEAFVRGRLGAGGRLTARFDHRVATSTTVGSST